MTSQHDKAERWRPRFSVRALIVVVTLVCCYAACWGPTKTKGVAEVQRMAWPAVYNTAAIVPLVVRQDDPGLIEISFSSVRKQGRRRSYYFWFFGYVAKLPW